MLPNIYLYYTGDREYHYTKDNAEPNKFVKDGERSIKDVGEYHIIYHIYYNNLDSRIIWEDFIID